ncbi:hypothetical protein U9M48_023592 [Paspalum notatum var. saurae]|uniref:Retrovirus-related Pol polyprotein from transposon TNT 1-94 n=1 Tax=Paspalum notatum var. saurae TaxID=547442 RepID=A0AAQ3WV90_PASNO
MNESHLSDFGLRFGKIPLLVDSTSAISVAKNPVLHSRTKHIDMRFHFLRDHYEKGDIDLVHVVSANQLADIFTKPLELQVEGVDNALIKGEIESQWTGLIALLTPTPSNGPEAMLGVGRPWKLGKRRGGSAMVVYVLRWTARQLRWTGEAGCHRGAPTRVHGAKTCEGGFGGFGSKPPPKFT